MKRDPGFAAPEWDDPFWQVVRMLVDLKPQKTTWSTGDVVSYLQKEETSASVGLIAYLAQRQELLEPLAEYLELRHGVGEAALSLMRTEEQAIQDYMTLSTESVLKYGTQNDGHHQSAKVMVATVKFIAQQTAALAGLSVNVDPQRRAAVIADDHIWVSPRRLDGALPALLNPVGIWEIKEYWGKTGGGSKMSDAIYECQLVGTELNAFRRQYGRKVYHYAILDGKEQWLARKSDVRRAVDLLYSGLLDELIVGSEVMTRWPKVSQDLCELAKAHGDLNLDSPKLS